MKTITLLLTMIVFSCGPKNNIFYSAKKVGDDIRNIITPVTPTVDAPDAITNLAMEYKFNSAIKLVWNAPEDNGTAITDYSVLYKKSTDSSYTTFNDGVSTNPHTIVTGLNANTLYDFKVKANNGSLSADSNIVSEKTFIQNDFFQKDTYQAINLGGATDSQVVALEDNTEIKRNGSVLVTLNEGQTHRFTSAQFDILKADKPIFVAGKLAFSNGNRNKANVVWNSPQWSGYQFLFSAEREKKHKLSTYAFEDTTIQIFKGSSLIASTTLTANNSFDFLINQDGSFRIESTGLATFYAYSNGNGNIASDPRPLLPIAKDLIGFPSNSGKISSTSNSANLTINHSDGHQEIASVTAGNIASINPRGSSTSLYRSEAIRVTSSEFIVGVSYADSNGNCSAPLLPVSRMSKDYALNVQAEWIAFASTKSGVVEEFFNGSLVTTHNLTRTGTNESSPYKLRLTNKPAGTIFKSNVKMGAWYEPKNDTAAANDDETIMFGGL